MEEFKNYVHVQYMECTKPKDGVDESLGSVCMKWSTKN